MSCPHCGPRPDKSPAPSERSGALLTATRTVALVGNPNVGKSCLFNSATGSDQVIKNAPGTTIAMNTGEWQGTDVVLQDLPGTYSLIAKSPDEQVTADALAGTRGEKPALAVVLLDSTALPRSLYLLGQVAQTGTPVVAALTMCDVARAEGREVDAVRLSEILGVPVAPIDPRKACPELAEVVAGALHTLPRVQGIAVDSDGCGCAHDDDAPCRSGIAESPEESAGGAGSSLEGQLARSEALFAWVDEVRTRLGLVVDSMAPTRSDKVDRVLLHPWVGIPVFAALMWLLFQLATSVAEPVMGWAEELIAGPVSAGFEQVIEWLGADGGLLHGLVIDGILAGVGVVFSFVPLMAIMFLAIAILDDSGYLARAAFVADRAMRSIGLDGRAILPLIVGFGCNLPSLAASQALPDQRQRTITAVLVPYTSCAARLTVYILLATVFFERNAGTVIFAMYVISVLLVVLAGLALRRLGGRASGRNAAPLLMVLPAYQVPRPRALARETWKRTWGFVRGAGKIIVVTLTAMWLLMTVPVTGGHSFGDVPVEDSAYGATSAAIAPVFAPAGYGTWQASAALITGFVAKEVVVGAFAQAYAVDEPDDEAEPGMLGDRLRASFEESSGGHGGAAAIAFMVFVLAYTPCLATLAEQRRILGWKTTGIALASQLAIAWVLSVGVFQLLRLVW